MPIGDRQASCVSWQQPLDLSIWCHVFRMLNFSHFIWSHRIAVSLGNCSVHPTVTAVCVIRSHLDSSHVFWVFFTSSQLFAAHVILSQFIWCHFIFFEINLLSCSVSWLFISCQNIWSLTSFSYACHSISFPNPTRHRSSFSMQATLKVQSSC